MEHHLNVETYLKKRYLSIIYSKTILGVKKVSNGF